MCKSFIINYYQNIISEIYDEEFCNALILSLKAGDKKRCIVIVYTDYTLPTNRLNDTTTTL
jgi:hypothetical protein